MAFEEILKTITLSAPSTAFSDKQYHMVKASSSEGLFAAGSTKPTGEKVSKGAIGVLQTAPARTGEAAQIAPFGSGGISKIVRDSTDLVPGKYFLMGEDGRAASTDDVVAQDFIYGPWMSVGASTDSIGSGMLTVVGITS